MAEQNRHCVVCHHTTAKLIYRPILSPGPVVRCLNCGMVYVQNIEDSHALIVDGPVLGNENSSLLTSDNLDDIEGCWELSLLPEKAKEWFAFSKNTSKALDTLERLNDSKGRILDFGCGWGFFLGEAKKRGWITYGLEPLPGHAVYARSIFGAKVTTDTLKENSYPPGFFDVITSFQVFEHLPDPNEDLRKLYRFLRPGGYILIEVPNIENFSVRLFGKRHRHFVQDHLNFFSHQTLKLLLENSRFEIVRYFHPTRYMSVNHLVTRWLAKFLPNRLRGITGSISNSQFLNRSVIGINLRDIVTVIAKKPD